LASVIASEFPGLRGTTIDLDPASDARALGSELLAAAPEDWIAIRGAQRYLRRLAPFSAPLPAPAALDPDAVYLLTGGLGGIGLQVVERFVESGAKNLLLIGRRAPDAAAEQRLRGLRETGARIDCVQADVASAADLARVIEPHRAKLRGVVHLAGVLDDGVLRDQTPQRLAAVMAPKADGAWNLHIATLGVPLDFFVLFASAASLLGPPGQGSYAAANAFLDGLASYRQAHGLPALSIGWGPWSETGMAAATDRGGKARWRARGIRDIAPKDGLDILQRLLGTREPAVAVLYANWREFATQLPPGMSPPLLRGLLPAAPSAPAGSDLRRILAEAPPNRRRAVLRDRILKECAKVLGLDAATVDPRQPLAELGLDSLMAVELRNLLGTTSGAALPATLLFDYPSVDALATFLAAVLAVDAAAEPVHHAPAPSSDATFVQEVEQLSEEEAESLLQRRLETMTRGTAR
jgi:NAD(P)-dependent dehydrogenase (short-subunit alcohol dehydrogenase family)/acyl carrier protein